MGHASSVVAVWIRLFVGKPKLRTGFASVGVVGDISDEFEKVDVPAFLCPKV